MKKMQEKLKSIGKPSPKHDDLVKVSGRLNYAEDYAMPGMLHAKVLRSKYPAAKILSINTAHAEALPGVKAVLTAKDVPFNNTVTKFGQSKDVGGGFEALYRVLAEDKVRFTGEAIALVAAETLAQAEEAVKLIEVDYEPLPGVYNVEEAVKPDSYKVGEDDTNIIAHFKSHKGDVEKGFSEADFIN
jgi:CO/xanthine dehydrogenase Mo-binding subunit